jgi:hypothetical protein
LELRHPKSAKRQVGAQKIKTMEASSGGMIDKRNHQFFIAFGCLWTWVAWTGAIVYISCESSSALFINEIQEA